MKKKYLIVSCLLLTSIGAIISQNDDKGRIDELKKTTGEIELEEGWNFGGGVGLDLGQMLFINPPAGSGQNRFGFGGAMNYFGNYRQGRLLWDNIIGLNLGMQKLGSGCAQRWR